MGRLGAMQRFASRCSWTVVVALVARILLVAARASSVVTHEAGEKVEHRTGLALRAALSAVPDFFSLEEGGGAETELCQDRKQVCAL